MVTSRDVLNSGTTDGIITKDRCESAARSRDIDFARFASKVKFQRKGCPQMVDNVLQPKPRLELLERAHDCTECGQIGSDQPRDVWVLDLQGDRGAVRAQPAAVNLRERRRRHRLVLHCPEHLVQRASELAF
jgi:hypothetical protein